MINCVIKWLATHSFAQIYKEVKHSVCGGGLSWVSESDFRTPCSPHFQSVCYSDGGRMVDNRGNYYKVVKDYSRYSGSCGSFSC